MFTLTRATTGGQFQMYEGLHDSVPAGVTALVLGAIHSSKKATNVSRFLLEKVGLDGKKVRTGADNETRGVSFRDLCHVCIITETDIQKKGSPIETGQVVTKPVEDSVFRLLLTGVDDSALVPAVHVTAASQSRSGKVEILDELIANCQQKIAETGEEPLELEAQLERLAASIARDQLGLRTSEERYRALLKRRNEVRQKVENELTVEGRLTSSLRGSAFVDLHYVGSDLARSESIREADPLLASLSPQAVSACADPRPSERASGERLRREPRRGGRSGRGRERQDRTPAARARRDREPASPGGGELRAALPEKLTEEREKVEHEMEGVPA